MKDYFIKEKFSLKRFGLESAILLFLVDSLYYYLTKKIDFIFIFILLFLLFIILASLFREKLLAPIHKLFLLIFSLVSKVTNPILIIFCYLVGILPVAIFYKLYYIINSYFKKKEVKLSYWKNADLSIKKIKLDEQY
jgi:hypothetical protein